MAYAVQSDLEAYFGEEQLLIAADREASGSLSNPTVVAVIEAGITAAEEEIDSYLAVRYDLPLAATPGVLKRVCCDLAMYHISVNHTSMAEDKETRYNNGVKWLDRLSRGVVSLGVEEAEVVVQDEPEIASTSETRIFSRTNLAGLL